MKIDCGRARRLLWPDAGPRAVSPEVEAARRHLDGCEACRAFLDEMVETAEMVGRGAARPAAPGPVRERLFAALARERARVPRAASGAAGERKLGEGGRGTRGPAGWWAAGILAGLLAVGAGLAVAGGEGGSVYDLGRVAEDHMRALYQEAVETDDPEAAERWLAARVPFAVRVPDLPDARLEGARLCFLDGRRRAVVRYRVSGRPVSYYVMADDRTRGGPPDATRFLEEAEAGYNVVAWRNRGLVHALVGDLPRERLGELARVCAEKLAAADPGAGG